MVFNYLSLYKNVRDMKIHFLWFSLHQFPKVKCLLFWLNGILSISKLFHHFFHNFQIERFALPHPPTHLVSGGDGGVGGVGVSISFDKLVAALEEEEQVWTQV